MLYNCKIKFIVSRVASPRRAAPRRCTFATCQWLAGQCQWQCHVAWQRKFQLQSETCSTYKPEMKDIAAKPLGSGIAVDRIKWRGNEPWSVWQPSGTSVSPQRRNEHTEPRCGCSRRLQTSDGCAVCSMSRKHLVFCTSQTDFPLGLGFMDFL